MIRQCIDARRAQARLNRGFVGFARHPAAIPGTARRFCRIWPNVTTKVLIVEDDLLNRMFYEAVFQQRGYDMMAVDDGARVLDAVDSFAPDFITMDIHLPHVSGRKLIRKIKRNPATQHIPILAITAYAGQRDEEEIRRAGAKGYLAKPLSIEQLLEEVDALLSVAGPAANHQAIA